jgi:hypothetical protein
MRNAATARNNAPKIAPTAIPALAPVFRPGSLLGTENRVADGSSEVERALVDGRVEKVDDSSTGVEEIPEFVGGSVESVFGGSVKGDVKTTVKITTGDVTISPGAVGVGVTMLVIIIVVAGKGSPTITVAGKSISEESMLRDAMVFVVREWLLETGYPQMRG